MSFCSVLASMFAAIFGRCRVKSAENRRVRLEPEIRSRFVRKMESYATLRGMIADDRRRRQKKRFRLWCEKEQDQFFI